MPEYFVLKSKICALQTNTHAMVYYVANINQTTTLTKQKKTKPFIALAWITLVAVINSGKPNTDTQLTQVKLRWHQISMILKYLMILKTMSII